MLNKDSIAHFLKEKSKGPLSFREITDRLKLTPPERRAVKKILRELVADGAIVRTRKGLYGPAEEMSLITGYFEAHRDGYGFVILETPGQRDIFIPARNTTGAMDNDRVMVRLEDRRRREGRIIRILERAHTKMVGILEEDISRRRWGFYVRPKNRAIPFDLSISHDDLSGAKDGDRVIAEILSYPSDKRPPTGRILKILPPPETPKDEVEGIVDEFHLPRRFSHECLEEAKTLSLRKEDDHERRKDLRSLPTVTIDGERAKDFDDAVSIEKTEEGYRLWVHIADVGHYVGWDTPLDREARKRGTSVYFPDRVIPMLPAALSEDLCSLRPKVERLAFTVEMDLDRSGEMTAARFYPSLIISDERMTYTAVRKILEGDKEERECYSHLLDKFELMEELCSLIKEKRMARGSLDFDLPEPEVLLDIQGNPEDIIRAERNIAHMVIEEFMIAANEAVAGYLEKRAIPSLYRVHEEPDSLKLDVILKVVHTMGMMRGRRAINPQDFPRLLKEIKGQPGEEIIHQMVLRSLKQARYSAVNVGHFGLASVSYSHFTSPIRRYPDLVVHRILREVLKKKHLSDKRMGELSSLLPDIAFHSSRTERLADEAEREVLDAMRVWFMKDRVGEELIGRVVSVNPYGLRVRFRDFYVDGTLHVSSMTDDFYRYDERTMSLHGLNKRKKFAIGMELTVRIERVDMEEREIVLGL
ncbi:MAG: ribonuclease R [Nitrospirales bacterium]|nr:ribonuclease R [Nitrospirales bacterium]